MCLKHKEGPAILIIITHKSQTTRYNHGVFTHELIEKNKVFSRTDLSLSFKLYAKAMLVCRIVLYSVLPNDSLRVVFMVLQLKAFGPEKK
jgi:hypothetical protein